jgi:hypothetical protein
MDIDDMDLSSNLESFHGAGDLSLDDENVSVGQVAQSLRVRRRFVYETIEEFDNSDDFQEWWTAEGSEGMEKHDDSTNSSGEHVDYYR